MRFLEKLFGKKEPEKKKIGVEQAKEKLRETYPKCTEIVEKIKSLVFDARKGLAVLEEKALPEIDERLYSAVKESRKQLIKKINAGLEFIFFPEKYDYENLRKTQYFLNKSLSEISKGSLKHSYYTGIAFKNELSSIGRNVKEITSLTEELGKKLGEIEEKNRIYIKIVNFSEKKEKITENIQKLNEKINEFEKKKKEVNEKINELTEKIGKISYTDQEKEKQKLEREAEDLENEIYALLASLSRPLKKYEKIGVFEKNIALTLTGYINEPVKTAFTDKENHLKKIIEKIEEMIDEFGLKNKEKIISTIQKIKAGFLDELKQKYLEKNRKINELNTQIKPLIEEKNSTLEELEKNKELLEKITKELLECREKILKEEKQLVECSEFLAREAC